MRKEFLLQVERSPFLNGYSEPIPCTNVCGFLDSVEMESIWNNGNKIVCSTASLDVLKAGALEKSYLRKVVPIGTIGFVEAVLQMGYGISKLIPTNIPQELQHDKYLHRKYCPKTKASNVGDIMKSWNVPKVFVKSAETIKSDITGYYLPSNLSELEDVEHEKVSVSSIVNFVSEWRCFVFGGMLRDLRYYCGNKWVVPDKDTINSMVNAVGTTMRAYTLDVGVLESGETAVVEVHNFISCGLYGATVPLLMYTAAYDEEIARHKKGA